MRSGFAFLIVTAFAIGGCSGHSISTVNGKSSASFKNVSVEDVCRILAEKFGPLKGYSADIPADLKGRKLTFSFSNASTARPVQKALADVTGYRVQIDAAATTIRFKKP